MESDHVVGVVAQVFQAIDVHQGGRKVAIKIVPAKSDDIYRIYFEREAAALRGQVVVSKRRHHKQFSAQ